MKITVFILSALLSLLIINSPFSAQAISSDAGKVKIGVVSASGTSKLDELVTKLAIKADKKGTSSFKMLSTTGNSKLHSVVVSYK